MTRIADRARFRPGRFIEDTDHDPTHTRKAALAWAQSTLWHGTRPPLAWRWRRARLPSASRLDSARRPDLTTPSRARLAACRVVDHRNQRMKALRRAVPSWARGMPKIWARSVAAPGVQGPEARAPSPPSPGWAGAAGSI